MITVHPPPDIDPDTGPPPGHPDYADDLFAAATPIGDDHDIDYDIDDPDELDTDPGTGHDDATPTVAATAPTSYARVRVTGPSGAALPRALLSAAALAVVAVTAHQVHGFVVDGPVLPTAPPVVAVTAPPADCVMLCDPPPPPPGGCVLLCDPDSPGQTRAGQIIGALMRAAGD